MKKIFIILILCMGHFSFSQVGINTNSPNADLDINGDINIRGKVHLGGTEGSAGNPGVNGQVLVSSGPGVAPKWLTLNIPEGEEQFYLIYNNTFEDNVGISFSSTEVTGNTLYTKGQLLSSLPSSWKKIPGMTQQFTVHSVENKAYFTFETVAQMNTLSSTNILDAIEFACGIFVNGQLEGIRINTVEQPSQAFGSFRTFTLLHVSENIPVGTHTMEVACTRRANYSTNVALGIGRAANTQNLNNFMAKSTMKVEMFEIPDNYIEP